MRAENVACLCQFALPVVDGQILFAPGDDEFAGALAPGRVVGSRARDLKETAAEVRGVTKAVTEDPKRTGRLTEAPGDFVGGGPCGEVTAAGLVRSLAWRIGGGEAVGGVQER